MRMKMMERKGRRLGGGEIRAESCEWGGDLGDRWRLWDFMASMTFRCARYRGVEAASRSPSFQCGVQGS